MNFEDLGIIEPILKALKEKNYQTPTPIQEQAIPIVLNRKDVLGCAQTGTGKTAAFSLPIIQLIHQRESKSNDVSIRGLIVTPTRELAIQIGENIKFYAKNTCVRHTVIFGGVKQHKQVEQLKKGVHLLVATPGRLLDLIDQGYIKLDTLKVFILDEADRMLDMGFIHDIKKLINMIPEQRQSLFFSATMPNEIVKLSKNILKNPTKIEVTPESKTADTVKQKVYYTNKNNKRDLLIHIMDSGSIDQVLVFSRTKHGADRIVRFLKKQKIKAAAIHGDKAQNQRQKALKQFKEKQVKVLVATDIAARGIDIDKLRFVINYDVPNLPETYVHRIGRSGRAGEEGIAISICEPEENAYLKDIEKLIGNQIEAVNDHPFPQTDKPMTAKEKIEWNKEKQKRKQEYFANRKQAKQEKNKRTPTNKNSEKRSKKKSDKPKSKSSDKPSSHSNDRDKNKGKKGEGRKPNDNQQKKGKKGRRELPPSLQKKLMWALE